MHATLRLALLLLLAGLFAAGGAHGQGADEDALVIPLLRSPVTFDGLSDEAAWDDVDPLPMTVYQPSYGAVPTERTELRFAHDAQYLYVAGRLYDGNPAGIRANSLYRDRYSGDDGIAVVLDTYDDNENALWFITTPSGVRLDWAIANDAESSQGFQGVVNQDWNTYWDVATAQTDEGWFAEIRIPFSSLGFQDVNGRVRMGLITYRVIARKNERHIFPNIPPDWDMGFAKPSQAQTIVLEGVSAERPVYVTPYLLGGYDQAPVLNPAQTAFTHEGNTTQDLGLDVKYNLTSNLTMDLTVNTDFAQVEADDQQVNLTRFSLFFPEKRQFFQERASVFDFNTGRVDRIFYSRHIGLRGGEPVRILGGARLVGRAGGWDLGLINMQTAAEAGLPGENFGVARLRRQVLNPYSTAGGIVTSRVDGDGRYNVVYGLDADFRVTGDEYLTFRWAQSFDSDLADLGDFQAERAGIFRLQWQRRKQLGLSYQATAKWYGEDFVPGLGFKTRHNVTGGAMDVGYGWLAGPDSPLRLVTGSLSSVIMLRNSDGTLESGSLRLPLSFERKRGSALTLEASTNFEDLDFTLHFPEETSVPAGRYTFYTLEAGYRGARNDLLRTNAGLSVGTFYDGRRLEATAEPTWVASRHLELSAAYALNVVNFSDRDQSFTAHVARLRAQIALNKRFSANTFLQYSSAGDFVLANIRFRYNFREGSDLWLVINEGRNTDRYAYTPTLPAMDRRLVMAKYTYTFAL